MDNGRIKALDIECFINGGCTLDDSELVRISETSAILVCGQSAEFLCESLWSRFFKYLPRSTNSSTLYLTFREKKKKNVVRYM